MGRERNGTGTGREENRDGMGRNGTGRERFYVRVFSRERCSLMFSGTVFSLFGPLLGR